MIFIELETEGLMLKKQYTYLVVGTKNCISIKVKLDRHWQDLEVFAVCYRDNKEYPYAITNGECLIADMAVISTSGEFKLKLLGSTADGNVVMTTNVVTVYINDNKFSGAEQVASDKKSVTELTGQAVKAAGNAQTYMEQTGQIKADAQTMLDNASQAMAEVIGNAKTDLNGTVSKAKADIDVQGAEIITQATAQADRAQSAADGIRDTADTLQADNEHLKAELKHANRRISVLYDLGKGITHRYETDSDVAYSKAIPSGAKVMDVKLIGGRSVAAHQYIDGFAEPLGFGYKYTDDNDYYNVTFTQSNGRFRWITLSVIQGHKYYQSLILQVVSGGEIGGGNYLGIPWSFSVTKADGLVKKDTIVTGQANVNSLIQILGFADSDGNFSTCRINKKSVRLIDLTQMFGAGNEPTLEQCREIFASESYPYNAGTLTSADVTAVQVGDKVISLPNSISLKSAGSVYDSLEFYEADGKYYQKHTQRVGVVDLGTLNWRKLSGYEDIYFALVANQAKNTTNYNCSHYTSSSRPYHYLNDMEITGSGGEGKACWIKNTAIGSLDDLKASLQGVLLYYELATPIVTVTEVDNRFDAVDCKAGDKITFVGNSGYHLPVPSEEEYLIALNEVTA